MKDEKRIIRIDANFEKAEQLFDSFKKYAHHFDNDYLYRDEFAFTTKKLPQYDGLLILNTPFDQIKTKAYPEWVFSVMMEPGNKIEHPWMYKQLEQYYRVFSPISKSGNTINSHGFLGWYLDQNCNDLETMKLPEKSSPISCVASSLSQLSGHRLRLDFIRYIRKHMPEIDFFGKGIQYIPDKAQGLLPYKYSIAIENSSMEDYFTEKINDCFLTYTIPFYYGCKNIGKYFPEKSYVQIDITNPPTAIKKVRETLERGNWEESLNAVKEARELIINRYQPLAGMAEQFRKTSLSQMRKEIILTPVTKKPLKQIVGSLLNFLNKAR